MSQHIKAQKDLAENEYDTHYSEEDGCWLAELSQWPNLICHGDTEQEAIDALKNTLEIVHDLLEET